MPDIKLISPLLDDFDVGDPISAHDGVCCYPAMRKGTDEKYIIKVISIPASKTQLDALLLTGAYPNEQAALSYFKMLADEVVAEIQSIQKLSALEGFLPFQDWQTVQMENDVGYQVYLLSAYQRTLEKQFTRSPMTHLGAVNLGLDLCASLAVCRRAGYLYVDLKPNNIYITADKEYRIGDLGFVKLDSLTYAALPDKYRSIYTAPELLDPFASLNTTVDIYATGLILYQAYNNGILPVVGDDGIVPPPEFADYEMAEIILKACAQDPADRWQEPVEMGQALVSYMQRNGANDTPIVPVPNQIIDEISVAVNLAAEQDCQDAADMDVSEVDAESKSTEPESVTDAPELSEPEFEQPDEQTVAEDEENVDPDLAFLTQITDETDPGTLEEAIAYNEVSDELNEILQQADELAALDVPEPVVAPQPVEINFIPVTPDIEETDAPVCEPAAAEEQDEIPQTELQADPQADEAQLEEATEATNDDELPDEFDPLEPLPENFSASETPEATAEDIIPPMPQKKHKGWLIGILVVLALAFLVIAGILYYRNFYLMPIDAINVEGNEDSLVVLVDADADEALLKVICSDSHGNQITLPVVNGKATFENLTPNTAYNIRVIVEGFHRLTGSTATAYSTPAQTNIVQFSAVTGAEDGSVILGFTVEGPDDGQWSVLYSAPGEAEQAATFPSHMVTLTGLTVGKEYTFRLVSDTDLYVTGVDEITFKASNLIYAQELNITSFIDGNLSVNWKAPEGVSVAHWTVRCYNDDSYNETIITTENTVVFSGLNHSYNYTVEVTAAGMSVSQRTFVGKNALTASNFQTDDSDPNKLTVSWEANSDDRSEGWTLLYTVDGSDRQYSVACSDNSAVIRGVVPGAVYDFALLDASGTPVLCEPFSYAAPVAGIFSGYTVTAENMSFRLYKAPDIVYTNSFVPSDSIYMKINLDKRYSASDDRITILFATRDSEGKVLASSTTTLIWSNLWTSRECILAIPYTPDLAGDYTICIYFNGQLITEQPYNIKNAAE